MRSRYTAARGRVRAVLAGSVVALAALATMPVRAAAVAPELVDSSVESGWSKSNQLILATFDLKVKASASSAVVTNSDGDVVASDEDCGTLKYRTRVVTNSDGENVLIDDLRTLEFVATYTPTVEDCRFQPRREPYTITITAANLDDVTKTTTESRSFRVDTSRPANPDFEGESQQVLQEDDKAVVAGITGDATDASLTYATDGTSGIAMVVLNFYNPAKSMTDAAKSVLITVCSGETCPWQDVRFAAEVDLEPGVWTVKGQAYDLAGNASSEAVGPTYVKLPA